MMHKLFICLAVSLYATLSSAAQDVGGMNIDYEPMFQARVDKAQAWQAKMSNEMKALIQTFEVFEAPPAGGMNEVRLLKIRYVGKVVGNIDQSAFESIENIVRLPGIKRPTKTITRLTVSNLDARRISFESDRYDGKLGAELLIIVNRTTNTAYQFQFIFSKKAGLNPFGSLSLADERTFANNIINTVRLANPTSSNDDQYAFKPRGISENALASQQFATPQIYADSLKKTRWELLKPPSTTGYLHLDRASIVRNGQTVRVWTKAYYHKEIPISFSDPNSLRTRLVAALTEINCSERTETIKRILYLSDDEAQMILDSKGPFATEDILPGSTGELKFMKVCSPPQLK